MTDFYQAENYLLENCQAAPMVGTAAVLVDEKNLAGYLNRFITAVGQSPAAAADADLNPIKAEY